MCSRGKRMSLVVQAPCELALRGGDRLGPERGGVEPPTYRFSGIGRYGDQRPDSGKPCDCEGSSSPCE
jgi:hypothetical protein